MENRTQTIRLTKSMRIGMLFLLCMGFIASAFSADFYWVGGTGNWSDHGNHWATTSGGAVFHNQVPSPLDNTIIDENSFPSGGTLTCDVNAFSAKFLVVAGLTTTPSLSVGSRTISIGTDVEVLSAINWSQSGPLNVNGLLKLMPTSNGTFNVSNVYLKGSLEINSFSGYNAGWTYLVGSLTGNTIKTNGRAIPNLFVQGQGGEWTLMDDLKVNGESRIQYGTFITGGNEVDFGWRLYGLYADANFTLNLTGSSKAKVQRRWRLQKTANVNVIAGTATVAIEGFTGGDHLYFDGGSNNYHNVYISYPHASTTHTVYVRDNNTINDLTIDFAGRQYVQMNQSATYQSVNINYNNTNLTAHNPNIQMWQTQNIGEFNITSAGNIHPHVYAYDGNDVYGSANWEVKNIYIYGNNDFGDFTLDHSDYMWLHYNYTQTFKSFSTGSGCKSLPLVHSSHGTVRANITTNETELNLQNVALRGINATGAATFNADNSFDDGNNVNWNFTDRPSNNFYWIGGTGNFNDVDHWATTSGGTSSGCLPLRSDNIFFDINSFPATGGTVNLVQAGNVNNVTWTADVQGNPTFTGGQPFTVNGDLMINAQMNYVQNHYLYLKGSIVLANNTSWNHSHYTYFQGKETDLVIDMKGKTFRHNVYFQAPGAKYTLGSDFVQHPSYEVQFQNGDFVSNGNEVDFGWRMYAWYNSVDNQVDFDFTGTSLIKVGRRWEIYPNQYINVEMGTADLEINNVHADHIYMYGGQERYNNVTVNATHASSTHTIYFNYRDTIQDGVFNIGGQQRLQLYNQASWNDVTINHTSTNSNYTAYNNFYGLHANNVVCTSQGIKNKTYFYWDGEIHNGTFPAGNEIFLEANRTHKMENLFIGGGCDAPFFLQSNSTAQATLSIPPTGGVHGDFIYIKGVNAIGGADFALSSCIDLGNNTGWDLDLLEATKYYWIGGSGDWTDANHWSVTSGGTAQSCVPTLVDSVVFDVNSFTASGGTVNYNSNAHIVHMLWADDLQGNPMFSGAKTLELDGDLEVLGQMRWNQNSTLTLHSSLRSNSQVTWNHSSWLYFFSDHQDNVIDLGGMAMKSHIRFDKKLNGNPKWDLESDFLNDINYEFQFNRGSFVSNGFDVHFGYRMYAWNGNPIHFDFTGTETLKVRREWMWYPTTNNTLEMDQATLNFHTWHNEDVTFQGGNETYHDINIKHDYNGGWRYIRFYYNNTVNDVVINNNGTNNYRITEFHHTPTFRDVTINSNGRGTRLYVNGNQSFRDLKFLFDMNHATDKYLQGYGYTANSLEFSPGTYFRIYGNQTVNLQNFIGSTHCTKPSTILGDNATTSIFSVANGSVDLNYVTLQNHTAQGGATFNASNATVNGTVNGWNISAQPDYNLYWVGGTGSWNDVNHWSFTSGGAGNGCVFPSQNDNAIFDGNSFDAAGQVVTMNVHGNCKNMIWNGVTEVPTYNGGYQLNVHGDLVVNNAMNWHQNGELRLYGSIKLHDDVNWSHVQWTRFYASTGTHTIDMGDNPFRYHIQFNGNATYELENTLTVGWPYETYYQRGTFKSNGHDIDFGRRFYSWYGEPRNFDFTDSKIKVEWDWRMYSGALGTVVADGSEITFNANSGVNFEFRGGGRTYYDVNFDHDINGNYNISILDGANSFHDVRFSPYRQKQIKIDGNNTYNSLDIEVNNDDAGAITQINVNGTNNFGSFRLLSPGNAGPYVFFHQDNTFGNLACAGQGMRVYLGGNKTQYVTDFTMLGTGGFPAFLYSTIDGTQGTIHKEEGILCFDYIWLKDILASGGAVFNAGESSTDLGNNSGWNMGSCEGYYWVGNSGTWSDVSHWATSSGGTEFHLIPPTKFDNVYFDANSFTQTNSTVTLDILDPECQNMTWVSAFHHPTLNSSSATAIEVYGSMWLTSNMTIDWNGDWKFRGSTGEYVIDAASQTLENVILEGPGAGSPGGTWELSNGLSANNAVKLTKGTFNTRGYDINATNFIVESAEVKALDLSSSDVVITNGSLLMNNTNNLTFEGGTSHIEMIGEIAEFKGSSLAFNDLSFKTNSSLNGTLDAGNTFNILTLEPGVSLETSGQNNVASIVAEGFCTNGIELKAPTGGLASINQVSGSSEVSFVAITDVQATGDAVFNANLSSGNGDVTGWNFTANAVVSVSAEAENASCPLPNDGTAEAVITGGTTPFTYEWSTLENTNAIVGLVPGEYWVTVTDSVGCEATDTVTILAPTSFGFDLVTEGSTICNGETSGTVASTVDGAESPVSYLWNNDAVTANQTDLVSGTYQLVVTDAFGCEANAEAIVEELPVYTIAIEVGNNVVCAEGSVDFVVNTFGRDGVSYNWTFGDGNSASTSNASNTFSNAGVYNVEVDVEDENGCVASATVEITVTAPLQVSSTVSDVNCFGEANGSVVFDVSGGQAPYNYGAEFSHSFDGTTVDANLFEHDGIASYTQNGELKTVNSQWAWNKNFHTRGTFEREEGKEFSFRYFHGSNVWNMIGWHGNSTGGNTYGEMIYSLYFHPGGLQIYEDGGHRASPSIPGFSVNSWYDCKIILKSSGAEYYVRKDGYTDYTNVYNSSYSSESNLRLGFTYLSNSNGVAITDDWKIGGGSPMVNLTAGTYVYEISDASGCVVEETINITEPNELLVTATATDSVCVGETLASLSSEVEGGTAPYSYNWSLGDGATSDLASLSHDYLEEGSYALSLDVVDANGCEAVGGFAGGSAEFSETFEGSTFPSSLTKDAVATYSMVNGELNVVHGSGWNKRVYTNQTFEREEGKTFNFRYFHGGAYNMIGWHGNSVGGTYPDLIYALYFYNGGLQIYEDGAHRGTFTGNVAGGIVNNTWYDCKIVLKNSGAEYYVKKDGQSDFSLVYNSNHSAETNLRLGMTYYGSQLCKTDNWLIGEGGAQVLASVCNQAPVAVCQDITIGTGVNCNASVIASQIDNGSSDPDGDELTYTVNVEGPLSIGVHTVELTVTDPSGVTSTCSSQVTVEDQTLPNVITQDITVQLDASGNATIIPEDINNGSSDACGIASITVSPRAFDCSHVGANTVILTVTDNNGNVTTETAVVTVEDNLAPVALTQNITVQLDASGNVAIVAGDVDHGSNDACGIASLAVSQTAFDCSHVGANTVTLTVTDNNGNVTTETAVVTVLDKLAPIISCPGDLVLECSASHEPLRTGTATATDNCGVSSIDFVDNVIDGACAGSWTINRTWTATDVNGNTSNCTQVLTIEDTTAPLVVCPSDIHLTACQETAVWTIESSDACSDVTVVTSIASGSSFDYSSNTEILVTATDDCGNVSTCSFTVTREAELIADAGDCQVVYFGYGPQACADLTATVPSGDSGPFEYEWSTGELTSEINVCPEVSTTYSLMVTDENGCRASTDVTVNSVDVRCGKKGNKVAMCHTPPGNNNNPQQLCLSPNAVNAHINGHGSDGGCYVGYCGMIDPCTGQPRSNGSHDDHSEMTEVVYEVEVYPNPFTGSTTIELPYELIEEDRNLTIVVINTIGQEVNRISKIQNTLVKIDASGYQSGVYFYQLKDSKGVITSGRLLVQ